MSKNRPQRPFSTVLYRKLRGVLLTVIELKQDDLDGSMLSSKDIIDALEYLDGIKLSRNWALQNCLKLAEQGKLVAVWCGELNGWRFSLPEKFNPTKI